MADKIEKDQKILENITSAIASLEHNDFKLYFFVVDSRGVPNGSLAYEYEIALAAKKAGFCVEMLYQIENEYTAEELEAMEKSGTRYDENRKFVGVEEWLGQEYADIPHRNIASGEVSVAPTDFMIIPEALSSLMSQTAKFNLPCKRIALVHNYNYIPELIPFNMDWLTFGIADAIAITQAQADLVKSIFPYVNTTVINPAIAARFRKGVLPKKLIVNVISKKQSDINLILKPFYWRYPTLKFVTFREIRNLPREEYVEALQESPFTIWLDDETPFGQSALEAMRCGNIIVGKIPDSIPEWMGDRTHIIDNGIWFDDIHQVPDLLSKLLLMWMQNVLPKDIADKMAEVNQGYTTDAFEAAVKAYFEAQRAKRVAELTEFKKEAENLMNQSTENETK